MVKEELKGSIFLNGERRAQGLRLMQKYKLGKQL